MRKQEPVNKQQIDKNWDTVVKMYNIAKERNLSNSHITGLLGNIAYETMGSFDPKQKQLNGPGIGLIQFDNPARLKKFLKSVKDPYDFDTQYNYILDTLRNESTEISTNDWGGYGNQDKWVKNTNMTPEESAENLSTLYFRPSKPNIEQRKIAAQYIHDKLQQQLSLKPDWKDINKVKELFLPAKKKGGWIQKAINPKHKGYCTPMTKSTCIPKRKALARTFKKMAKAKKHESGGLLDFIQPLIDNFKSGGKLK